MRLTISPMLASLLLFGGCGRDNDPWTKLRRSSFVFPVTEDADRSCTIRHGRTNIGNDLYGSVRYLRVGSTDVGNQAIWPNSAELCYTLSWYDIRGSRTMRLVGNELDDGGMSFDIIGRTPTQPTNQSWPIVLTQVSRFGAFTTETDNFGRDLCERITRIEGEFAGDITIHVEPAGPECDRIPYTVRYVAQEIFRR